MSLVINSPVWRPFTQHALQPGAHKIVHAEGAWLTAEDGTRFLDAISSWWVITHGHRRPEIMEAIRRQTESLDQIIFAGFTHEPAEALARRLVEITPEGLDYVFYSDSGSTSVEVAIKMALGYWRNRGAARTRVIAMEHSYHGDTVGTMSAGARSVFNAPYEPLLFDVARVPFPHEGAEQGTLDALELLLPRRRRRLYRRAAHSRRGRHVDLRRACARRDEARLRNPRCALHRR